MQEFAVEPQTECTVGVIYTNSGLLFFKNRDLQREFLVNRRTVFRSTPEVYALEGANLKTLESAGVSIGINKHRICVANTHVDSTEDVTYDVLCETVLNKVKSKSDVPKIVKEFMDINTMHGGRILISSLGWTYLVEVYKKDFMVKEIDSDIAITNRFDYLSHEPEKSKVSENSSNNRLEVANQMIKDITTIGELKSMLRSHFPEKGELSICNHRQDGGGTESSHIIQIQGEYIGWSSLFGPPCENDYNTVQLFFQ